MKELTYCAFSLLRGPMTSKCPWKEKKVKIDFLICLVCVSIHRWYELVHAYMKATHLFIEIDARKKHERRMQTHNNRTKKAKWVLSDFAKWHASSNSKFIWPPLDHYTTLLSRLRRLGKYIHNVRKRSKEFRPASKSSKSFLCWDCPSQLNSWGGGETLPECDLTRDGRKRKQMSLSASVYFSSGLHLVLEPRDLAIRHA